MTRPTILVRIKNVYGSEMIYPACDKAQIFAYLAGTKTLSRYAIERIKALGYAINVQPQTL